MQELAAMGSDSEDSVHEPFQAGRRADRLLADFAIMISFLPDESDGLVLDYGCGSGWLGEFLSRLGYRVTFFDVSYDAVQVARRRTGLDARLRSRTTFFVQGLGQNLPFAQASFRNICCFDSLHHILNMEEGLKEIHRVLQPGGSAIFVEPGSRHSSSKETQEFLRKYKSDDPDWIEQDVVLSWVDRISKPIGFSNLWIKPTLLPSMILYPYETWDVFRQGDAFLRSRHCDQLASLNEQDRVIFALDKPHPSTSAGQDDTVAFVKSLYRRVLYREPSEQEVQQNCTALKQGKVSREKWTRMFLESQERKAIERSTSVPSPSLPHSLHRFVYRLRKACHLLRQGDVDYVLRRIWSMIKTR